MSNPTPRALREWLALSLEEREAIVAHYGHGCRDCRRKTSLWVDSDGNRRCEKCWGIVSGGRSEAA